MHRLWLISTVSNRFADHLQTALVYAINNYQRAKNHSLDDKFTDYIRFMINHLKFRTRRSGNTNDNQLEIIDSELVMVLFHHMNDRFNMFASIRIIISEGNIATRQENISKHSCRQSPVICNASTFMPNGLTFLGNSL